MGVAFCRAGGNPCANTSLAWGGLFVRSWYTSSSYALYARSN